MNGRKLFFILLLFVSAPAVHSEELQAKAPETTAIADEALLQKKLQASARGGGALSAFGGPNSAGFPLPLISYEGRLSPGNSPSFTENKLSLSSPFAYNSFGVFAGTLSGSIFHLGSPVTLNNNRSLKQDWYRTELGIQVIHPLPEQKTLILRTSLGYAGDAEAFRMTDASYSAALSYALGQISRELNASSHFWILSLFYSNNSSFLNSVPLPGVSYVFKSPGLSGVLGFPIISLQGNFAEAFAYSFSAFGPTVQSEITHGEFGKLQPVLSYSWMRQRFVPEQRQVALDRLTIEEMKLSLGLRQVLHSNLLTELQAGRSFHRSLYIGENLSDRSGGFAAIQADWYLSLSLKLRIDLI